MKGFSVPLTLHTKALTDPVIVNEPVAHVIVLVSFTRSTEHSQKVASAWKSDKARLLARNFATTNISAITAVINKEITANGSDLESMTRQDLALVATKLRQRIGSEWLSFWKAFRAAGVDHEKALGDIDSVRLAEHHFSDWQSIMQRVFGDIVLPQKYAKVGEWRLWNMALDRFDSQEIILPSVPYGVQLACYMLANPDTKVISKAEKDITEAAFLTELSAKLVAERDSILSVIGSNQIFANKCEDVLRPTQPERADARILVPLQLNPVLGLEAQRADFSACAKLAIQRNGVFSPDKTIGAAIFDTIDTSHGDYLVVGVERVRESRLAIRSKPSMGMSENSRFPLLPLAPIDIAARGEGISMSPLARDGVYLRPALRRATFALFAGPSGAGKSTAFKKLAAMARHQWNDKPFLIRVDESPLEISDVAEWEAADADEVRMWNINPSDIQTLIETKLAEAKNAGYSGICLFIDSASRWLNVTSQHEEDRTLSGGISNLTRGMLANMMDVVHQDVTICAVVNTPFADIERELMNEQVLSGGPLTYVSYKPAAANVPPFWRTFRDRASDTQIRTVQASRGANGRWGEKWVESERKYEQVLRSKLGYGNSDLSEQIRSGDEIVPRDGFISDPPIVKNVGGQDE